MMNYRVVILLAFATTTRLGADDAVILNTVQAVDDTRVTAMIAADSGKLDLVLSDVLHYGHSAVLVENKTEFIARLATRRAIYQHMDFKTRTFSIIAPGVVLGKGRAFVDVGNEKMIFRVDINFLAVWRLENQQWRLVAWQSCRNGEPVMLGPPTEKTTGVR